MNSLNKDLSGSFVKKVLLLEKECINAKSEIKRLREYIYKKENEKVDSNELLNEMLFIQEEIERKLSEKKIGALEYIKNSIEYKIGDLYFQAIKDIKKIFVFRQELNALIYSEGAYFINRKYITNYSDLGEHIWALRHKRMTIGETILKVKNGKVNIFNGMIKILLVSML